MRGDFLLIAIPDPVWHLLKVLGKHGHEAYIVGGCVRDSLMGRRPSDWDIATSAYPNEIKTCFPRTFDTGIAHGTVTVVYGGKNYEITTFRLDGKYEDGRHPTSVSFTRSLEDDLARRDFTMNALAWHPESGLIDPFGGQKDIENRLIRGVGNPNLRFKEDALRMMRAVRFSSQLNFNISPETLSAIKDNAVGLKQISAERVRDELTKMLLSPHPEKFLLLLETKLIQTGWPIPLKPDENEIRNSIGILSECPKKVILAYAVLLYERGPEDAYGVMNALRFSKVICRETSLLVKWAKHILVNQDYPLRKYLSLCGVSYFQDILTLKQLMKTKDYGLLPLIKERYDRIVENGDCLSIRDLQITGNDLLEMGLSGKAVGEALEYLLDMVLRNPSQNEKLALCDLVNQNEFLRKSK